MPEPLKRGRLLAGRLHLHQYPRLLTVRTIDSLVHLLAGIDRIRVTIKRMGKEIVNPGLVVFLILLIIQLGQQGGQLQAESVLGLLRLLIAKETAA